VGLDGQQSSLRRRGVADTSDEVEGVSYYSDGMDLH